MLYGHHAFTSEPELVKWDAAEDINAVDSVHCKRKILFMRQIAKNDMNFQNISRHNTKPGCWLSCFCYGSLPLRNHILDPLVDRPTQLNYISDVYLLSPKELYTSWCT